MVEDRHTIAEFLSNLHQNKTCGVLSFEALGDKRVMYRANGRSAESVFEWI